MLTMKDPRSRISVPNWNSVFLLSGGNFRDGANADTGADARANSQLIPGSSQTLPFACSTVAAVADPNGHIAICATVIDLATSLSTPFLYTITFDPATGAATIPTSGIAMPGTNPANAGLSLSLQGKYLALSTTTKPFPAAPF